MKYTETKKKTKFSGPDFLKAHTDHILLVLPLMVLAAALFNAAAKKPLSIAVIIPHLRFTHYWNGYLEEGVLENLVSEFEESRGNIKIILDPRPYEEARKLALDYSADEAEPETSSGEIPKKETPGDILAVDPLWTRELLEKEVLDPSFPQKEPIVSFFYPLFYNIEMLKKAGFNRPPKTRNEFLSFAAAVTDPSSGNYGAAFALGESNSLGIYREVYPWFWAAGISLLGESGAFEETLDFFSVLHGEGIIHPESFSMSEEEKREAFIKNKTAFMIGSVGDIAALRRRMGENAFGIGVIPAPDSYSGKPAFGVSGWSLGVFRGGKHREEAADFVSFLAENSALLAEKSGAVPGPGGGNSLSPELLKDPFYSKAWELYISGELAREFSDLPGEALGEDVFREELINLFDEKQTPASAAASITKRWGLH